MKNYYEIIGVDKSATIIEIKKAYRKRAKELHPDTGGSNEEFNTLNEAYEVLSNDDKRSQYDISLSAKNVNGIDWKRETWIKDILVSKDIRLSIDVPLKVALFGGKVKLTVERTIDKLNGMKIQKENITINIDSQIKPMSIMKIDGKGNTITRNGNSIVGDLYVIINYPLNEDGIIIDNHGINISINVPFYTVWMEKEISVKINKKNSFKFKLDRKNKDGIYKIENTYGKLPVIIKVIEESPKKNYINDDDVAKIIAVMEEVYGMYQAKSFSPNATSSHHSSST